MKAVSSSSAPHAVPLLSVPSSGILHTLRNLRPQFFEGLTPSELELVIAAAKQVWAMGNSVITNQDHPAEHLYLLLTGRARYFFVTETGKKIIVLWIPPGQTFGGAALVASERLLENHVSETYIYLVAYRAAHVSMIFETAPERLAHVLTSLASGIGQKVAEGVELNIRNEELANEANVNLFTTSRLLSKWQRSGMVRKGRGKILLRSPELLLRHAT